MQAIRHRVAGLIVALNSVHLLDREDVILPISDMLLSDEEQGMDFAGFYPGVAWKNSQFRREKGTYAIPVGSVSTPVILLPTKTGFSCGSLEFLESHPPLGRG